MSRVLLVGAFGQGNPGDEALLAAFRRALRGNDLVAATSDPSDTAERHGLAAVDRFKPPLVAREAQRADAVVCAGGTVFKRLHASSGRRPLGLLRGALALALGSAAMGKPLALVGVGAAELRGRAERRLARRIVRNSDLLILRDQESAELLASAGAPAPFRVGADPSWILCDPEQMAEPVEPDGPVIVALSHLAGDSRLGTRLALALAPVTASGVPVLLQPWQAGGSNGAGAMGDQRLAERLARRLSGDVRVIEPPPGLEAAIDSFSGARLVLGLRFHSLVAAAAAGIPFVAYAHEPKLAALARRLRQPAVPASAPPELLGRAVLDALEAAEPPARESVHAEIAGAEESFRLLRVLVSGGSTPESELVEGLELAPREWVA